MNEALIYQCLNLKNYPVLERLQIARSAGQLLSRLTTENIETRVQLLVATPDQFSHEIPLHELATIRMEERRLLTDENKKLREELSFATSQLKKLESLLIQIYQDANSSPMQHYNGELRRTAYISHTIYEALEDISLIPPAP